MKPPPFRYHAPRTEQECLEVLGAVGHEGKILAGGQSLIPILNFRLATPRHLIDINQVTGWDRVEVTDTHVRIGALVRHTQLEHHAQAYAALPLLRQALINVAHTAIRNRGTTGPRRGDASRRGLDGRRHRGARACGGPRNPGRRVLRRSLGDDVGLR